MPKGVYDHRGKRMGHKHSEETKRKIGISNSGEKSGAWKGDKVGYLGIHAWVRKVLGTPSTCKKCGKKNLFKQKINWANISKKYLRDKKDWIRLCVPCHAVFDGNRGRKKLKINLKNKK